ncbi:MAG: divalent metal cation transporter, partial [Candidatus Omnitrophica bacterium]|nr:divalent metal cation transporter [Candidatus Omnitrophota bacterium]
FQNSFVFNFAGISFLLALMGWMPAPIDISVWHSIWCAERRKQTDYAASLQETQFDFHLGYWGTMVMAVLFVCLGALVMYGTGEVFSDSAVAFTGQVVSLYTKSLGEWSYPVIVTSAALTMFSTTLSCLDAYSRIVKESAIIIAPAIKPKADYIYFAWMVVLATVSVIIIGVYIDKMKALVDLATILSFLAAPVLAYMNLKVVTSSTMPKKARPSARLVAFSWFGIIFLTLFSLWYLGWRIFS